MYGVEWLIVLGLLGLAAGLLVGYLLGGGSGGSRKSLETKLSNTQRELDDYRQEVVSQFSETARKFQALNDAYTDLHEQLARSSGVLCKDTTGPLLTAPAGHQDLIPADVREEVEAAAPAQADTAKTPAPPAQDGSAADPYEDDDLEIRVSEPAAATAASATASATADAAASEAANASADGDAKPEAEADEPETDRKDKDPAERLAS